MSSHVKYLIMLFFIVTTLFLIPEILYAQNSTLNNTADRGTETRYVILSRISSANTIILKGTSFVGSFDTTYTISGSKSHIRDSNDVILRSITDDFTNSSTIGYVKLSNSVSNNSNLKIVNPFVSKERVEQKIDELLESAILEASNANDEFVSITCNFGSSLNAYSCLVFPSGSS